jgi:hypothetical protein
VQTTPRQTPRASGGYVGAAILIVIGLVALVANLTGMNIGGESVVLVIGLAFIVAYVMTRHYGFMVPGGIMTGLGGGMLAASLAGAIDNGTYVVLGLGLGFMAIYAADLLVTQARARWWPVIPGGALLLVAGGLATQNEGLIKQIGAWSPLVLVAIGVWWLLAARNRAANG